jgi:hypothetical protein
MSDFENDLFSDDPFADDPFADDPFADDPFEDESLAEDLPDQAPVFVVVEPGDQADLDVELGPATAVVVVRAPPGTPMAVGVPETPMLDPIVEVVDGTAVMAYNDDFDERTLSSGVTFTMPDTGQVEVRVNDYSNFSGPTVVRISAGTADTDPIDLEVLLDL